MSMIYIYYTPNTYKKIKRSGYWYVLFKEHPNSSKQGYVAEHRLLIENKINRYLKFEETVHHINGNRLDNSIENLELFKTRGEHTLNEHPEVINILRTINKGIRRSPKTEFKKGQTSWNKGKILSKPKKCIYDKCTRSSHYKEDGRCGYCSMHYQQKFRYKTI